jgi:hypothetical protein
MALPRRLEPGRTHAVTRRCARRTLLLRPDEEVNQIVLFSLGVALTRHSVELHAFLAESNHTHTNATDDAAELSDFFRDFHSLVARALNARFGRGENLWAPGSFDNVEIHDQATLEEQLLYLWTNPVKDGLVERPEDWPGVFFLPEDFGREITVRRPESAFFGGRRPPDWEPTYGPARAAQRARLRATLERRRARTRPGARPPKERAPRPERGDRRRLPETVTFRISAPPGYDHMTLEEVRAHFRKLLDQRVAQILAERRAQGLTTVKGAPAVLAQDPLESAGDTFPTFGRNPRIACFDRDRRLALLAQLQAWRLAHRVAYELWRSGQRGVEFPSGTYGMRRFHGARVKPPEPVGVG